MLKSTTRQCSHKKSNEKNKIFSSHVANKNCCNAITSQAVFCTQLPYWRQLQTRRLFNYTIFGSRFFFRTQISKKFVLNFIQSLGYLNFLILIFESSVHSTIGISSIKKTFSIFLRPWYLNLFSFYLEKRNQT